MRRTGSSRQPPRRPGSPRPPRLEVHHPATPFETRSGTLAGASTTVKINYDPRGRRTSEKALLASERANLVGSLLESIDDMQEPSVAAAWDEEVDRRLAEIDSGAVKSVSPEAARRRLSSILE
jgi:putative addiction module component (TIGR02574 family)